MQQKVAKCQKCGSTSLTFSTNQDKYICKDCGFAGEKFKEGSKFEEERKKLMDLVVTSKTRKEIDTYLRKKEKG